MEPWQQYLDELRQRAARIPPQAFGRSELLAEAAHDAYEHTTNQLTQQGWDEEEALTVTRMFGQAVKEWIARNGEDWDELGADLDLRYTRWSASDRGRT